MSIEKRRRTAGRARKPSPAGEGPELRVAEQPRVELNDALQSLIRANAAVTKDSRLPSLLQVIVEAARDLCGARCAALFVTGQGSVGEQVIQADVEEATPTRSGLPGAAGILGLHVRADHPPMTTVLDVPIFVGGEVYGNLHLTESRRGAFTPEDEELLVALAGTAGTVIASARRLDRAESQRSWLESAAIVNRKLLRREAGSLTVMLEGACRAAGADASSLVTDIHGGTWTMAVSGSEPRFHAARAVEGESTLAGRAMHSGEVVRVDDIGAPDLMNNSELGALGPGLAVPLTDAESKVFGCLIVARTIGRPAFTDDDVDDLSGFANHVAVAIELDQSLRARETVRAAEDHARIAAELHAHVIHDLSATALQLEGAAMLISAPDAHEQVTDAVTVLDATIQKIRTTIFGLEPRADRHSSMHHRLLETVQAHEPALGFSPTVTISGSSGPVADRDLIEDVLAVANEALSNVARHANASAASIEVAADGAELVVTVTDDGDGMGRNVPVNGLTALRELAATRSGRLDIATGSAGGTRITWTVAVRA